MPKRGRPKSKGRLQNFRFAPPAKRALERIARHRGWTKTLAAERAILFAESHPEFGVLKEVA